MNEQPQAIIVYATFPDMETATRSADTLVGRGIAACVNLLPAMTSLYRWQGKVESAHEVVMIVKTRPALADQVIKAIEDAHPYDTPAVIVLEISGGSKAYLDWIMTETENPARQET